MCYLQGLPWHVGYLWLWQRSSYWRSKTGREADTEREEKMRITAWVRVQTKTSLGKTQNVRVCVSLHSSTFCPYHDRYPAENLLHSTPYWSITYLSCTENNVSVHLHTKLTSPFTQSHLSFTSSHIPVHLSFFLSLTNKQTNKHTNMLW